MLDLAKSEIIDVTQYPLHSSVLALEEGTAMVFAMENGIATIKPSAGSSGEVFAGIAQHRHMTPTQINEVVVTAVPATGPYTVTLPRTPIGAGSVKVYIDGTAATQGTVADNVYSISGSTLTFHSADAGLALKILYRWALSAAEAAVLYGGEALSSITIDEVKCSVIAQGTVCIDNFLLSDSWEGGGPIYLGANGKLSLTAGTGTLLDAQLKAAPSVNGGMISVALKP